MGQSTKRKLEELRQRASDAIAAGAGASPDGSAPADLSALVYELQVHQVELEMQNQELRDTQVELSETIDRYRDLYDLAPVGYLTLDSSGTIHEANLMASELLGMARSGLVGRALPGFLSQVDADALHRHLQEALSSESRQQCDLAITAPDGRTSLVRLDSTAVRGGATPPTVCRTTMTDLTRLKTARARHAIAETRLEQIATHLKDVLAIRDHRDGRIVYVTPSFEALFGRRMDAAYRAPGQWLGWIHGDDRVAAEMAVQAMSGGVAMDDVFRLCRPDGGERRIRVRSFPVENDPSLPHHDIVVVQDVSREHDLNARLRALQRTEALGVLAGGVAHDFNNVLQAVLGCVNLARRPGVDPERALNYLNQAAGAIQRGGDLARQLLALSRKEAATPRPVHVDTVVNREKSLLDRLLTEQITLEVELGAPEGIILGDDVLIERVLLNLAANARDAMPDGGVLSIRTDEFVANAAFAGPRGLRPGRHVRLLVRDSGEGMEQETCSHVFDPFFTTKDVGQGTGLGLATVFSSARQLGGGVEVTSTPGRGTTFTLYLPCVEIEVEPARESTSGPVEFSGTALVVEDKPLIRMAVCHELEALGFDVLVAEDATAAMRAARTTDEPLDLLVADVVLPVVRGPKLAAWLLNLYPDLKVLFMSATPASVVESELAGAEPVLTKPFSGEQFAERLTGLFKSQVG